MPSNVTATKKNGQAFAATNQPRAQDIANQFVQTYYRALGKTPEKLHMFYNNDSVFALVGEGREALEKSNVVGRAEIQKALAELDYSNCRVAVKNFFCQYSVGDSVIVVVTGIVVPKGQKHRNFSQTFVLAPGSGSWYVRNEFLQYMIVETTEDKEPQKSEAEPKAEKETKAEPAKPAEPAPAKEAASEGGAAASQPASATDTAGAATAAAAGNGGSRYVGFKKKSPRATNAATSETAEATSGADSAPAESAGAATSPAAPNGTAAVADTKDAARGQPKGKGWGKPAASNKGGRAGNAKAAGQQQEQQQQQQEAPKAQAAPAPGSWAARLGSKRTVPAAAPAAAPATDAPEVAAGAEAQKPAISQPASAAAGDSNSGAAAGAAGAAAGSGAAAGAGNRNTGSAEPATALFVSGLPEKATNEEITGVFARFGDVKDVRIHAHKNFCFVQFGGNAAVEAAMTAQTNNPNTLMLRDSKLMVDRKRQNMGRGDPRGGSRGGRRGGGQRRRGGGPPRGDRKDTGRGRGRGGDRGRRGGRSNY